MPLADVRYRFNHEGSILHEHVIEAFAEPLARAIATNFTCNDPGSELNADDIEVHIQEGTRFDRTKFQLFVRVEMRGYPERLKQERTDALRDDIRQMLPSHVSFAVWVCLGGKFYWAESPAGRSLGALMENPGSDGTFAGHVAAHDLA